MFVGAGVVNASIARQTKLAGDVDVDLVLEGLWRGTQHRQARGRGARQPQLHVEYETRSSASGPGEEPNARTESEGVAVGGGPSDIRGVTLDATRLGQTLADLPWGQNHRCRMWKQPRAFERRPATGSGGSMTGKLLVFGPRGRSRPLP